MKISSYVIVLGLTHDEKGGSNKQFNRFCEQSLNSKKYKYIYITNSKNFYQRFKNQAHVIFLPFICHPFINIFFRLSLSLLLNFYFLKKISLIDFFNPIFLPSIHNQVAIIRDIAELSIKNKYDSLRMLYRTKIMLPLATRFSSRIVAISNATKNDLIKYNINLKHKINVILHGADKTQTEEPSAKKKYFVTLGRLDPIGKNLIKLLESYKIYRDTGGKYSLHFIGSKWRNSEIFFEKVSKLDLGNNIEVHDYLSEADKNKIIREAQGLIFISRYEGFGHPVLESLSLGTIPLLSDIPVFREIGSKYAIYCNPVCEYDICRKIRVLEEFNYDFKYKRNVDNYLNRFSWKNMFLEYENIFSQR